MPIVILCHMKAKTVTMFLMFVALVESKLIWQLRGENLKRKNTKSQHTRLRERVYVLYV